MSRRSKIGLVAALIAAITALAFAPSLRNGFVYFDDDAYITDNPQVAAGLGLAGVRWAFESVINANWHPLTWLSHMLDVSLFGMAPWGHHLSSAVLHVASTALVFLLLRRWTGALWPAALAALFWGLHPLRVESVAWAAERKDVLSVAFGLLALLAYDGYVRRGGAGRLLASCAALALGLMTKPMLVTLPCVLLLLDVTVYRRLFRADVARVLAEKVPFAVLSFASAGVTLWVQRTAMQPVDLLPPAQRLLLAIQATAAYLWNTVFPWPLAPLYPLDTAVLTPAQTLLPAAVVVVLTLAAILLWRTRLVPAGWFLFLGTLAPVSGIVHVGNQSHADRYTYLPSLGLALIAAWGLLCIERRGARARVAVRAVCCIALVPCIALTWRQTAHWRDTEALFTYTLAHTRSNSVAHNNLGRYLIEQGRVPEGIAHIEDACRIAPGNLEAQFNLGSAYLLVGDPARAANALLPLAPAYPNDPAFFANLATALYGARDSRFPAAASRALELLPAEHPARMRLKEMLLNFQGPA